MSDKLCAYVEFVLGYENNILEFPCTNERKHGLFCEEHKEFANTDYNFSVRLTGDEFELFDDTALGLQKDTILDKIIRTQKEELL
jgi:hypothetical protein